MWLGRGAPCASSSAKGVRPPRPFARVVARVHAVAPLLKGHSTQALEGGAWGSDCPPPRCAARAPSGPHHATPGA